MNFTSLLTESTPEVPGNDLAMVFTDLYIYETNNSSAGYCMGE